MSNHMIAHTKCKDEQQIDSCICLKKRAYTQSIKMHVEIGMLCIKKI